MTIYQKFVITMTVLWTPYAVSAAFEQINGPAAANRLVTMLYCVLFFVVGAVVSRKR